MSEKLILGAVAIALGLALTAFLYAVAVSNRNCAARGGILVRTVMAYACVQRIQ